MSYKTAFKRCVFVIAGVSTTAMFLLIAPGIGETAARPTTVAEIALYQGPDREQLLMEGAKKEGQLVFFTDNTGIAAVAKEFEKKYPFVKMFVWRADDPSLIKKVVEEYEIGRAYVDVLEQSHPAAAVLHSKGIFQEYYSPDTANYDDEVKTKGKTGVFTMATRELNISLGFNTRLVPPAEAPKTYKDLLDPKWKGKIGLTGGSTGPRWIGHVQNVMGREYLEKLSRQDIKVHNISGAALANLIVAGEVALAPAIFDSNIYTAKKAGAPVEWRPLEPTLASFGTAGMAIKAPHPHAARLFLDYLHSKEGQQAVRKRGLGSPRLDVKTAEYKFKRTYIDTKYSSIEEYEKKFAEWEELLMQLFIRKR